MNLQVNKDELFIILDALKDRVEKAISEGDRNASIRGAYRNRAEQASALHDKLLHETSS